MTQSSTTASAEKQPVVLTGFALTLLNALNDERQKEGVRLLVADSRLLQAGQEHAEDMMRKGYFHYEAIGANEGLAARVRRAGYTGKTGVNLGRGTEDVLETLSHWMSDTDTRKTLVEAEYRDYGVGMSAGVWVLLLGKPDLSIEDAQRQRVRTLLNEERTALTLPQFKEHALLNHQAQVHCIDMVARNYCNRVTPDGKDEGRRAGEAGYEGRVQLLLAETESLDDACKQWLNGAITRAPLIDSRYVSIGVGMFNGKWAVLLGSEAENKPKPDAELTLDLLPALNLQRQAANLQPLQINQQLTTAAAGHVGDMSSKGFFGYEQPGSLGITGWLKDAGYKGRTFPAITRGPTTIEAAMKVFLGSAGHREQLLQGEFRDVGIGVKAGHWVLILGAPQVTVSTDLRDQLQRHLNAQRVAAGSPPVEPSLVLNVVAQHFAEDMVKREFFSYTNPDGQTPDGLLRKEGFTGSVAAAIAKGVSTPEAALAAWLKSPQNRQNLLEPRLTRLGVGVSESRWVLLLGST